jgi:hypothetical protein
MANQRHAIGKVFIARYFALPIAIGVVDNQLVVRGMNGFVAHFVAPLSSVTTFVMPRHEVSILARLPPTSLSNLVPLIALAVAQGEVIFCLPIERLM